MNKIEIYQLLTVVCRHINNNKCRHDYNKSTLCQCDTCPIIKSMDLKKKGGA